MSSCSAGYVVRCLCIALATAAASPHVYSRPRAFSNALRRPKFTEFTRLIHNTMKLYTTGATQPPIITSTCTSLAAITFSPRSLNRNCPSPAPRSRDALVRYPQ
ncbi:hypothetical protein EV714DRAFT_278102 [Schizophyllum commune]